MPLYETVVIARQDLATAQVDELTGQLQSTVGGLGGKTAKTESWGLRNLAYKIKKNRKGHYVLFNFDAPPQAIHELERTMRINEDVLRYLTIKVDEFEDGQSAILRQRDDSEEGFERAGGGDRGYRARPRRDGNDTGEEA
jgi:small subunit ribosomal protein S6